MLAKDYQSDHLIKQANEQMQIYTKVISGNANMSKHQD